MKKAIYSLLLMAAVTLGGTTLVSCGDDVEENTPTPQQPASKNYAHYIVKVSEDIFAVCDGVVTLEHDGKTETYKLDDKTRVEDTGLASLMDRKGMMAGRILDLSAIEFGAHPFKASLNFHINEAGQKMIAENPDQKIDIAVSIKLGDCNARGEFISGHVINDNQAFGGIPLKGLEQYLSTLEEHHAYQKILK